MSNPVAQIGPQGANTASADRELTPKEMQFVDVIAAGGTLSDGAKAAGVSYRSAKRWHRKEQIVKAVRARTTEALSQARAVLASGAARAATELVRLAARARPDSARVAAGKAVIETATRAVEIEELESRLAEIESALTAPK